MYIIDEPSFVSVIFLKYPHFYNVNGSSKQKRETTSDHESVNQINHVNSSSDDDVDFKDWDR